MQVTAETTAATNTSTVDSLASLKGPLDEMKRTLQQIKELNKSGKTNPFASSDDTEGHSDVGLIHDRRYHNNGDGQCRGCGNPSNECSCIFGDPLEQTPPRPAASSSRPIHQQQQRRNRQKYYPPLHGEEGAEDGVHTPTPEDLTENEQMLAQVARHIRKQRSENSQLRRKVNELSINGAGGYSPERWPPPGNRSSRGAEIEWRREGRRRNEAPDFDGFPVTENGDYAQNIRPYPQQLQQSSVSSNQHPVASSSRTSRARDQHESPYFPPTPAAPPSIDPVVQSKTTMTPISSLRGSSGNGVSRVGRTVGAEQRMDTDFGRAWDARLRGLTPNQPMDDPAYHHHPPSHLRTTTPDVNLFPSSSAVAVAAVSSSPPTRLSRNSYPVNGARGEVSEPVDGYADVLRGGVAPQPPGQPTHPRSGRTRSRSQGAEPQPRRGSENRRRANEGPMPPPPPSQQLASLGQLLRQVRVLETENAELKKLHEEMKGRLDSMTKEKRREVKSLKDLADAKAKALEELQAEHATTLENNLKQVRKETDRDRTKERERWQAQLQDKDMELAAKVAELHTELQNQKRQFEMEKADIVSRNAGSHAENVALKEQISALKDQFERLKAELNAQVGLVEDRDRELHRQEETFVKERESLNRVIEQYKAKSETIQKQVRDLERKLEGALQNAQEQELVRSTETQRKREEYKAALEMEMEKQTAELRQTIEIQQQRAEAAETQVKRMTSQLRELEARAHAQADAHTKEAVHLERRVSDAESALALNKKRDEDWLREQGELKRKLKDREDKLKELRGQCKNAMEEVAAARAESEAVQSKHAQLEQDWRAAQSANSRLKADLQNRTAEMERLKKELETAARTVDEERSATARLEKDQTVLVDLQLRNAELQQRLTESIASNQEKIDHINALQQSLRNENSMRLRAEEQRSALATQFQFALQQQQQLLTPGPGMTSVVSGGGGGGLSSPGAMAATVSNVGGGSAIGSHSLSIDGSLPPQGDAGESGAQSFGNSVTMGTVVQSPPQQSQHNVLPPQHSSPARGSTLTTIPKPQHRLPTPGLTPDTPISYAAPSSADTPPLPNTEMDSVGQPNGSPAAPFFETTTAPSANNAIANHQAQQEYEPQDGNGNDESGDEARAHRSHSHSSAGSSHSTGSTRSHPSQSQSSYSSSSSYTHSDNEDGGGGSSQLSAPPDGSALAAAYANPTVATYDPSVVSPPPPTPPPMQPIPAVPLEATTTTTTTTTAVTTLATPMMTLSDPTAAALQYQLMYGSSAPPLLPLVMAQVGAGDPNIPPAMLYPMTSQSTAGPTVGPSTMTGFQSTSVEAEYEEGEEEEEPHALLDPLRSPSPILPERQQPRYSNASSSVPLQPFQQHQPSSPSSSQGPLNSLAQLVTQQYDGLLQYRGELAAVQQQLNQGDQVLEALKQAVRQGGGGATGMGPVGVLPTAEMAVPRVSNASSTQSKGNAQASPIPGFHASKAAHGFASESTMFTTTSEGETPRVRQHQHHHHSHTHHHHSRSQEVDHGVGDQPQGGTGVQRQTRPKRKLGARVSAGPSGSGGGAGGNSAQRSRSRSSSANNRKPFVA